MKIFLTVILLIVGLSIVFGIVILIMNRIKDKKLKEKTIANTLVAIDNMTLKRAFVNTDYIKGDLQAVLEQLLKAYYSSNVQGLPTKTITYKLYMEYYNKLKREYELGIKNTLYDLQIRKMKFTSQDISSMHTVKSIGAEVSIYIDYYYYHITKEERITKEVEYKAIYVNTNNGWGLDSIEAVK